MKFFTPMVKEDTIANEFDFELEESEHRGERYKANIEVPCESPVCHCKEITVSIVNSKENPSQRTKSRFTLDIAARKIVNDTRREDVLLNRAFVNELGEEDWQNFDLYFRARKYEDTQKFDVNTSDLKFPQIDAKPEQGDMIHYSDVFPYDKQLIFSYQAKNFIIVDYYCLRSKCDCTSVRLDILKVNGNTTIGEKRIHLYFNYKKQAIEEQTGEGFSPEEMSAILEEFHSLELSSLLEKRHSLLKTFYAKSIKTNLSIGTSVASRPANRKSLRRKRKC
ncbi:MAG: hypothetical protein AAF518_12255 [Spirochaetota bacterium]